MPDWVSFNQGIQDLGSQLGGYFQKKKDMQDAMQMILMKAQIEQQIKQSDPYQQSLARMMNAYTPGKTSTIDTTGTDESGNVVGVGKSDYFLKPSFGPSGPSFSMEMTSKGKVKQQRQEELGKGIPTSEAGKFALAEESVKNIDDIMTTLFPGGTPESFDRETAKASNLPMNQFPVIGAFIPPSWPGHEKGQNIFRKMGAALSGRQLIQTGVAARPEETAKLVAQFAPNWFSNPKAAYQGLTELQNFYKSYMDKIKNKGFNSQENTTERSMSEGMGKKYIKTGTYKGQKVGQLSDGTIEVIQ